MEDKQELTIKYKKNDFLRLIATLSMLIGHTGAVFFPSIPMFRIIGRISFSIFCYQSALGYKYTKDLNKYINKLLLFAAISQLPYMLAHKNMRLNVMFTFALALFFIDKIEKKKYLWIVPILFVAEFLRVDYGAYGILLVLGFHLFNDKWTEKIIYMVLLNVLFIIIGRTSSLQLYSLLSLPLIALEYKLPTVRLGKNFSYLFYPIHLALFALIRICFL